MNETAITHADFINHALENYQLIGVIFIGVVIACTTVIAVKAVTKKVDAIKAKPENEITGYAQIQVDLAQLKIDAELRAGLHQQTQESLIRLEAKQEILANEIHANTKFTGKIMERIEAQIGLVQVNQSKQASEASQALVLAQKALRIAQEK